MDPTTDPALRSWVHVPKDSHFPIQNLPYGVFVHPDGTHRAGVAIGEEILDLTELARNCPSEPHIGAFGLVYLTFFLHQGPAVWRPVRQRISQLLRRRADAARQPCPA